MFGAKIAPVPRTLPFPLGHRIPRQALQMVGLRADFLVAKQQISAFQTAETPVVGPFDGLQLPFLLFLAFPVACCAFFGDGFQGFRPFPQKPTANGGATMARRFLVAFALQLIVEGQLRARGYVLTCEQTHFGRTVDVPFLSLAIGIAGVVHEPEWEKKMYE